MKDRIYLSSPTIHTEEREYVKYAFDTNWVSCIGENIDLFERAVCEYTGVRHAAALSSGTAALHLAVKLAGIDREDIVICSDMTFSATVNPVSYEGGIQVFVDSERESWNIDPELLERALKKYDGVHNRRAKAVIVAHLYGTPSKMDEICALCEKYGVTLIEDAAESLGALYRGRQTGTFSRYGIYSFNGNKIITTSGGGMLVSDDPTVTERARYLAFQAREPVPHYQHSEIGYNYRMSNILAGIGRGQIIYLDRHIEKKKKIYEFYKKAFADLPVRMNPHLGDSVPNYWLSCITVNRGVDVRPHEIMEALGKENIESRPIWKPMHMQPVFRDRDFIVGDVCVDEDIFARGLCLPSDIKMTEDELSMVADIVRSLF